MRFRGPQALRDIHQKQCKPTSEATLFYPTASRRVCICRPPFSVKATKTSQAESGPGITTILPAANRARQGTVRCT